MDLFFVIVIQEGATMDYVIALVLLIGLVYYLRQAHASQKNKNRIIDLLVIGSARLAGYETISKDIYHYVAGEGFDSTDPSNRVCYYYDSNNQKTNLGDRHMNVTFQTMARLTDDMGICY